ncbi:ylmG homolog protein 1-2, chloroplastic-like [Ananas comosus]|uniref:YlmG homolog protein 1-2, chloroplastic-like n=2 Tax=Ananas comosus TaxID=4615 RepID=A0A6P5FI22_ANACO|nr:ylmG homolog protein 1-2, chloroplastic-like [Ananas comosus]
MLIIFLLLIPGLEKQFCGRDWKFEVKLNASSLAPPPPLLSSSTRTLTTLLSLALSASRALLSRFVAAPPPSAPQLPFSPMGGPLFFAALRDRPSGYLNTPLTVVAAGMAKWLDIYSGVLMVRVLLSWFPNIPWDRQPLSAIRDLCDPYLNLFRNIIPPVFDTLDVSPLLAFAVLGTLSSILNNSRGMY